LKLTNLDRKNFLAPLLLHLELCNVAEALHNCRQELFLYLLALAVLAEGVLEDVVSEVALHYLVENVAIDELFNNCLLLVFWCLIDADLNELGGELVLG